VTDPSEKDKTLRQAEMLENRLRKRSSICASGLNASAPTPSASTTGIFPKFLC
jgi:hypothetical protein